MTDLNKEIEKAEHSYFLLRKELTEWDESVYKHHKLLEKELDEIESLQDFIEPEEVLARMEVVQETIINAYPPEEMHKKGHEILEQIRYFGNKLTELYEKRDGEIDKETKALHKQIEKDMTELVDLRKSKDE